MEKLKFQKIKNIFYNDYIMEYINLINNVKKLGCYVNDNIEIRSVNGYRGVFAKNVIKKGELLIKFDFNNFHLNKINIKHVKIVNMILEEIKHAITKQRIINIMNLLTEFDNYEISEYKYYLNILPKYESFKHNPCILYHNHIYYSTFMKLVHKIYDVLCNNGYTFSIDDVMYCYMLVNTRSWNQGMFPFVDMLNHSSIYPILIHNSNKSSMITNSSYQPNEEVYISYDLNSRQLYDHHGFIEYPNFKVKLCCNFSVSTSSKNTIQVFQEMYPENNIKDNSITITLTDDDYILYNNSNNQYDISNHLSSILKYTKYVNGKFDIDNNIFISILKSNLLDKSDDEFNSINQYITRHNYVLQKLINLL